MIDTTDLEAAHQNAQKQYEAAMERGRRRLEAVLRQSFVLAMYNLEGLPMDALSGKIFVFCAKAGLIKDIFGRAI